MKEQIAISMVKGREILDSRGNPTVEAEVLMEDGSWASAAVPSGASTGSFEAYEKRDNDPARYMGKGTMDAVANINGEIAAALCGENALDQSVIDAVMCKLDGTENKSRLGANAILAVSVATAKAAAISAGLPLYRYLGGVNARKLPLPTMNILNGGAHAQNGVDIQEFMIAPAGAPTFREGLRWCAEVFHTLRKIVKSAGVGDEGGYAPELDTDEDALSALMQAVKSAGFEPGRDFLFSIDAAVTEWYNSEDGKYYLPKRKAVMTRTDLCDMWKNWCDKYPMLSIEDGMGEDDWDGWQLLTKELGSRIMLVGDDLFVTNTSRIKKGAELGVANSVLVKMNQIGTLTETLEAVAESHRAGYRTIISHRSGETEDTTIADLAVATGSGFIKTGAPSRSDRTAKYNRLLRIEEELGNAAVFGTN